MTLRHWPEAERPRERLLQHGAGALSDAELLAIFLRTGLPGRSVVEIARDLIARYGGLRPLLEADHASLCQLPGLGLAKIAQLQAALEMGRRYLRADLERGDVLSDVAATRLYLTARLRHHGNEVFAALFLDNRHRAIAFEELFSGTIDAAAVYPRQILRRALHHNAAALILAHNHPSGSTEPSEQDARVTHRIRDALALVDVRLLDHFVIGDGPAVSLAERGLL